MAQKAFEKWDEKHAYNEDIQRVWMVGYKAGNEGGGGGGGGGGSFNKWTDGGRAIDMKPSILEASLSQMRRTTTSF